MPRAAIVAAALLVLDVVVRLLVGTTYFGATFVLLAATGIAFLPFLPGRLAGSSMHAALVPLLGVGSFAILLTTVSLVGVRLTETSIRIAVAGLVVSLGVAAAALPVRDVVLPRSRRELAALGGLAAIVAVSLASSWEVVDPFPPPGSDWAFYLLYADEVEAQGQLLVDNPHAIGEARSLANYPGIGAVYGSLEILDGVSSRSLAYGIVGALALTPLAVYAAVAGLWGIGAGMVAAALYAVAPVHLEPLYWHGLATTLALGFVALILLALGLVHRGERGPRVVLLLAVSLAALAAVHVVSAVVAGLLLAIVLLADGSVALARRTSLATWWRSGVTTHVLAGAAAAVVLGAGVVAHLRLHGADSGSPVSYRFFDRDWVDAGTIDGYFSWVFLLVVAASVMTVAVTPRLRRDAALLPVAALGVAALLVSQAWRVHVPFEYRRVVYYLGLAMVVFVGVAALRVLRRPAITAVAATVVLLVVAQVSIGLRLPARLLDASEPRSATVDALEALGDRLGRRDVVVTDRCLGVRTPYFLGTPTLIAAEEWQVGFSEGIPEARRAMAILAGGVEGRRLAKELGVRYAVVDPACTPDVASRLGGETVLEAPGVVVVEL